MSTQDVIFEFNHKFDEYFTPITIKLNSDKTTIKKILEEAVKEINEPYVKDFGPVLPQIEKVSYTEHGSNNDVKIKVKNLRNTVLNGIEKANPTECFCEVVKKHSPALYAAIIDSRTENANTGVRFTLKSNPKYDNEDPKWLDD